MQRVRRATMATGLTLALSIAGIGCGSDAGDGNGSSGEKAYLTIVGDDNLFAESGERTTLVVRYHDVSGRPLAGAVAFRIDGAAGGAELSATSAVTDGEGHARVDLDYGDDGDVAFRVIADAANADEVMWRASVLAPPLRVNGRYYLESLFVLADGLPPGQHSGLQTFLDMTDDLYDPATWILDQVEGSIGEPWKTALQVARVGLDLDRELYDLIIENSPALVVGLVETGGKLAQLVENLGLASLLEVGGDDIETGALSVHHQVTGALYLLDGDRYDYSAAQMGLTFENVGPTGAALQSGKRELGIDRHRLELPYGEILLFGLDKVVAPSVDPFASSFAHLLANLIDCTAIGKAIADELPIGSASVYKAACEAGVAAGVSSITADIADMQAELFIKGAADLVDGNKDNKVERLANGEWEGELVFDAGPVVLQRPDHRFVGTRLGLD
jgi:hypothetical protein